MVQEIVSLKKAIRFLKPETEEAYNCALDQYTIPCYSSYENILNDEGIRVWNRIQFLLRNNQYVDTIDNWYLFPVESGMWRRLQHPGQNTRQYQGINMILHTNNNLTAMGTRASDGLFIRTSLISFRSQDWIYTVKGHLYRLGERGWI